MSIRTWRRPTRLTRRWKRKADIRSAIAICLLAVLCASRLSAAATGMRLSLVYGDCREFAGLDVGVVSCTSESFSGIGVGGVNIVDGRMRGVQAGLFNWCSCNDPDMRSLGIQYGLANYANSFFGLQDAYLNCAGDFSGVQCGGFLFLCVNVAYGKVEGCQLGLVNYAQEMTCGVQIGILNIIARNGMLPVLPILNGGF